MQNAVIFGSTSDIAQKVIYSLAMQDYNLFLLGRDMEEMERLKMDLSVRNPKIQVYLQTYDAVLDVGDKLILKLIEIEKVFSKLDLVLIAHGLLSDQKKCEEDFVAYLQSLQINALSVIEICHALTPKFKKQLGGTLAVISSVAGIRGRQSNYAYGSAKGLLNIYLQGLRNSLCPFGVQVLTILPGFVDTKMTASLTKNFLFTSPEKVARDIIYSIKKRRNILYTPWFWRGIMFIINSIPESVFKKLKL